MFTSFSLQFFHQKCESRRFRVCFKLFLNVLLLCFQMLEDHWFCLSVLNQLDKDENRSSTDCIWKVLQQNFCNSFWKLKLEFFSFLPMRLDFSLDHVFKHSVNKWMSDQHFLDSRWMFLIWYWLLDLSYHFISHVWVLNGTI